MTQLLETSSLPTRVLRRTFSHRLLARQPPPIEVNLECYYCGTLHPKLQIHVYESVLSYFLLHVVQFVTYVLHSGLALQGEAHDGLTYIPLARPYAFRYLQDLVTPLPHTHTRGHTRGDANPQGLVHTPGYATPKAVQRLVSGVVSGLMEAVPSIEHALL